MSPEEIDQLIDTFIIDNNIMAIDPAKMRAVLKAITSSLQQTDLAAVTAERPLVYDPYSNRLYLPPIQYKKRRLMAKTDGNFQLYLEDGDIVNGWSPDGLSWWDSAIYNGGNVDDVNSYTVIVGNQILT